jgi:hypothetical protein
MPPGPEPTMLPMQPIRPDWIPTMPMAPGTQPNPEMPIMQPSMPPAGPGEVPRPPVLQPPSQGEIPAPAWPIALLPGQGGLTEVSSWLLRIVPVLFPGLYPGWTWWPTTA